MLLYNDGRHTIQTVQNAYKISKEVSFMKKLFCLTVILCWAYCLIKMLNVKISISE